jgi:hypothetical protein
VDIEPRLNPWIFGNWLIGGVIRVIVDPATGAMWDLTPEDVEPELVAKLPSNDTIVR